MKYEIQKGDILDLIAPYDVNPTNADLGYVPGFKVGGIIALAVQGASSGGAIEGQVVGCATVLKAAGAAWAVGDEVYWDDSAKGFTKTSSANTKAGYAITVQASGDTVGGIRLVPTLG